MAAINATAISLFYRKHPQELLLCPLSLCLGGMEVPGCREGREVWPCKTVRIFLVLPQALLG